MSEKIYIFLTKNIWKFCPLYEPDYYTKLDEKDNTSKVSNDLLKNNCEFEGLEKFKIIINCIVSKILSYYSQIPKDWNIKLNSLLWKILQYVKFVKYWYTYFLSPK